ncbi:MAG: RES domain-containing protein, partial [Bacteroidetes bacterium]|nr:RES domain-containing protein [Bacteroidota bacterium]
GWDDRPYGRASQAWGDTWIREQTSLALKVPSVVEPLESNYLINPGHPEVNRLDVGTPTPLSLDPRLRPGGPAESE